MKQIHRGLESSAENYSKYDVILIPKIDFGQNVYIHAYIHTYIHTYIHAYMHTYIN